jgi:polyphosphate kinase
VSSIVGEYLEHARLMYFHNNGDPKVLGGSADIMVRSFERRIEAMFYIVNEDIKKEAINILYYNLKDNRNSYLMREDGSYLKRQPVGEEPEFNVHKEFYNITLEDLNHTNLFEELNPGWKDKKEKKDKKEVPVKDEINTEE